MHSETQPGSSTSVGEAKGVGDDVLVVVTVYGGGEVKAYPVLEQDEVSDANSEAKSASYPKGELSCS
jgi:hypothetical protein